MSGSSKTRVVASLWTLDSYPGTCQVPVAVLVFLDFLNQGPSPFVTGAYWDLPTGKSVGGWGGESFVTPPTGKSCFVFVFALRACATRREIIVYLGMSLSLLLLLLLLLLLRAVRPDTAKLQ